MEFLILNRHQVTHFHTDLPFAVISICEPTKEHPEIDLSHPNIWGVHWLTYTDEDQVGVGQDDHLFKDEQAESVLDFVEGLKDKIKLLICQCDGGISRSSGTAAALSVILNGPRSDKWIFDSAQYIPNMYVYRKLLNKWLEKENNKD